MNRRAEIIWPIALVAGMIWGCATYRPAPLEPAKTAQLFESRSLSDPGLCNYLKTNLGPALSSCPPKRWDLGALTLAGFYYSPDIAIAQARVEQADAAIITAGARPNPTMGLGPQYTARGVPSFVPWGIGTFNLNLPIETAGKRGYRIAEAERLADAAKLELGGTAWKVRSRIRSTLLTYLLDARERELWEETVDALAQATQLTAARVRTGAASQPELSFAESVLEDARVKAAQASALVPEARAALASAVGLPIKALDGIAFSWPNLDHPPLQQSLSPAEVQRVALTNRIDLRVQLARYAAADEALKLELAKQYPDINPAGGYTWESGENLFDLGPSLVLPVFNQNQGPIAEAQARRKGIGAEFLAMQAAIIGQARGAFENYRGAVNALGAADRAMRLQGTRLDQARRAFAAGETDAAFLAQSRLQALAARQTELAALRSAQNSLGAIEDVVQRPLENGDIGSFVFPVKGAMHAAELP